MGAHHKQPRSNLGRPSKAISGVVPGSNDHRILLALRGPGGMTSEQITARFGYVAAALHRLKTAGLIELPKPGQKGVTTRVTEAGRQLTNAHGPLARAQTLITYCQL